MSYEDYANLTKQKEASPEPGTGQGVGKPKQGQGGFDQCVCPKCGYTAKHDRGTPCNAIECPECNVPLQGKA